MDIHPSSLHFSLRREGVFIVIITATKELLLWQFCTYHEKVKMFQILREWEKCLLSNSWWGSLGRGNYSGIDFWSKSLCCHIKTGHVPVRPCHWPDSHTNLLFGFSLTFNWASCLPSTTSPLCHDSISSQVCWPLCFHSYRHRAHSVPLLLQDQSSYQSKPSHWKTIRYVESVHGWWLGKAWRTRHVPSRACLYLQRHQLLGPNGWMLWRVSCGAVSRRRPPTVRTDQRSPWRQDEWRSDKRGICMGW